MSPNDDNRSPGANFPNRHISGLFPATLREYSQFLAKMREKRDGFWRSCAEQLIWDKPFSTIAEENFNTAAISWFSDGMLNAAVNALDHNLNIGNGSRKALVTFSENGMQTMTYEELFHQTSALAAALKAKGFSSGSRVALYLPNCAEAVVIMMACARLGIPVVLIPVRFTAEVTAEIIRDSGASLLMVRIDPNRESDNERIRSLIAGIRDVTIISAGSETIENISTLADFLQSPGVPEDVRPVSVNAEHPLSILYANSGSGIPRGSLFATGGYLTQSLAAADALFSFRPESTAQTIVCDLPLTTASGLSLGFWGPLLCGKTLALIEGNTAVTPELVERIAASLEFPAFLTTPPIIAELRLAMGERKLPAHARFMVVACSGDTLTPRLVSFAGAALTEGQHRVLNLWVQNETGTALITTFATPDLNRPGSLGLPFPGIEPMALNNFGEPCRPNESGQLVFLSSWPAMIRTIWNQPERFREFYFRRQPGNFSTSDGIRIDGDGFCWFMGRLDDVIKVRGQSFATSEIEAVLISHPEVSEVAVISPQGEELEELYAFVVLASGLHETIPEGVSLEQELKSLIIRRIGEFAVPTQFIFTSGLPRTRTGKIVRRILRRVISGDITPEDDLSHVANPQTVEELIRKKGL